MFVFTEKERKKNRYCKASINHLAQKEFLPPFPGKNIVKFSGTHALISYRLVYVLQRNC